MFCASKLQLFDRSQGSLQVLSWGSIFGPNYFEGRDKASEGEEGRLFHFLWGLFLSF
jgi:hypothetical protein